MFRHMETLPLRYFDTHPHGDIMSVYTNDIDTLRQMISQGMPPASLQCDYRGQRYGKYADPQCTADTDYPGYGCRDAVSDKSPGFPERKVFREAAGGYG